MSMQEKKLSVVILTYDSYRLKGGSIELVITSILNQTYQNWEIILIDNNPEPNSAYEEILENCECEYKVVFTGDNRPMGQAKNFGGSYAEGDTLVFIDDDTIICDANAFLKICEYSSNFLYGYGAKRFWTYPPGYFQENRETFLKHLQNRDYNWLLKSAFLPSGLERLSGYRDLLEFTFPGNFSFIRKRLFEDVGGFCDRFEMYGWDDDYLGYLIYRTCPNGFRLLFEDISVLHINHPMGDGYKNVELVKNRNYELYKELLEKDGVKSFNINVLFGIPDFENEAVVEKEVS
jgi:glycosyltransferase involved in cell wall biosynthesis